MKYKFRPTTLLSAASLGATFRAKLRTTLSITHTATLTATLVAMLLLPAGCRRAREKDSTPPHIEQNLLNEPLTRQERKALKFLYQYMPLNDRVEHSTEYFIGAVRQALRTKEMPWGKIVPDDLFRHFVLPPRVNNEYLDNARDLFYRELYPRVKDLSMYDAVLEVNHWCREKVVYRPTDGRTSPPVQVVARGYGRCGEESVVAVAALRSIGIPARQVYVPRWAHTDDNHAWVEVWVDGQWYYMGACEPEPELNRGWFTGAASRAMMVNTWVYGRPKTGSGDGSVKGNGAGSVSGSGDGSVSGRRSEVVSQNTCYTEVTTTAQYAAVKEAVVKVVDGSGKPVKGASVSFGLYNYAEFYPLARRTTDRKGLARLTTGLGTLFIEACMPAGDRATVRAAGGATVPGTGPSATGSGQATGTDYLYAAAAFHVGETDTLTLKLVDSPAGGPQQPGDPAQPPLVQDFRLTPPPQTANEEPLDPMVEQMHKLRCAIDDSLRSMRNSLFPFLNPARFASAREKYGTDILSQTLNNGLTVEKFLETTSPEYLPLAVKLLETLRVKDLQEVSYNTLCDWLNGVIRLGPAIAKDPLFQEYILNPRVDNEPPLPYREVLWELLTAEGMETPVAETAALATASATATNTAVPNSTLYAIRNVLEKIKIDTIHNPRNFPISPAASARYGTTDPESRGILAVALCRTAGIPARKDPVSGRYQMWLQEKWVGMTPESLRQITPKDGGSGNNPAALSRHAAYSLLTVSYAPDEKGKLPAYDTQFTIQRWSPETPTSPAGYKTLGFAPESGGVEGTRVLNTPLNLECGLYRIVSGVRLADGTVLARIRSFELEADKPLTVELDFAPSENELVALAHMDVEWRSQPAPDSNSNSNSNSSNSSTTTSSSSSASSCSILETAGRNFFVLALLDPTGEPSQHFIREFSQTELNIPVLFVFPTRSDMAFFFRQNYPLPQSIHYGYDGLGQLTTGLEQALETKNLKQMLPAVIVADSFGNIYYKSIGYRIGIPAHITGLKLL